MRILHTQQSRRGDKGCLATPVSELDAAGTPALGTTPNPAVLEGDMLMQPPARTWLHQRLWPRSAALLQPPQPSPQSMLSTRSRSTGRTVRDDTVADLASALLRHPPGHGHGPTAGDGDGSSAALARGMSHTDSWQPVLDRRQSWDAQEYKHDLLKRQCMDGQATTPGNAGGFSET
ncbi:hypothetical protein VTH06DRAFT_287 [Thermothelomyces fergusii]